MSNITLFDLAAQIRAEIETIDAETGEISQAYTDNRELFERDKGVACVAYYKDEAGRIASAKDMLAAMQQQIKTRETRLDGFKDYLRSCMGIAGISQIKSADGLLTATLYPERDEAVEIDAGADIPEAFCIPPKPPAPKPDKRLLAEAIKAGQPVPEGVRLVKRDRLTIK